MALIIIFKRFRERMSSGSPNHQLTDSIKNFEEIVTLQRHPFHSDLKGLDTAEKTSADKIKDQENEFLKLDGPEWLHPMDISFEKDFLVQHIKVLDLIAWNFKESTPPAVLKKNPLTTTLPQQVQQTLQSSKSTNFFLNSLTPLATQVTIPQFINDLKMQRDLHQFLNHIIQKFSKEVSTPLVLIMVDLWAYVRKVNFREKQFKGLSKKAHTFTTHHLQPYYSRAEFTTISGSLQSSPSSPASLIQIQKFRDFLRKYVMTILLVCGGYFENPFANGHDYDDDVEVDYPKRQSSSVSIGFLSEHDLFSDSEFESEPTKKVKTE